MSFSRGRRVAAPSGAYGFRCAVSGGHPLGRGVRERACIVFNLCERTQLYDRIVKYDAVPVA